MPASYFVRLRGLPFAATEQDVRNFLGELTAVDIELTKTNTGKPSGECYVELATRAEQQAVMAKDRENIGKRYIEVFEVVSEELDKVLQRRQVRQNTVGKGFVRMKGLPFNATRQDIERFFDGLVVEEVELGREQGSHGRLTGEAYVQLGSPQDADKAMERNRQHVGSRYVELYKSDGGSFMSFRDRGQMDVTPLRSWLNAPTQPPMPMSAFDGYGGAMDPDDSPYDSYDPYGGGKRRRLYDPTTMAGGTGGEELFGPMWQPTMRGRAPPMAGGYGAMAPPPVDDYTQEELELARRLAARRRAMAATAAGYDEYDYGSMASRQAMAAGRSLEEPYAYEAAMGGRMRRQPAAAAAGQADPRYAPYGPSSRHGPGAMPGHHGAGDYDGYGARAEQKEKPSPNKLFVRGLPFKVTGKEVEDFFAPYECLEIKLGIGQDGRVTGDAMVEFPSAAVVRQAIATKDRQSIGDRYVELYASTEMRQGIPPNNAKFTRVGGVAPYEGALLASKREVGSDPLSASYGSTPRAAPGAPTASGNGANKAASAAAMDPWLVAAQAAFVGRHGPPHYNVAGGQQPPNDYGDDDPYTWR